MVFHHPALSLGFPLPSVSLMSQTVAANQRGKHGALIVVTATKITCHALSIVHAQQPMGVATHTQ